MRMNDGLPICHVQRELKDPLPAGELTESRCRGGLQQRSRRVALSLFDRLEQQSGDARDRYRHKAPEGKHSICTVADYVDAREDGLLANGIDV